MLQKRPPHLQVKPVSPSFLLQTLHRLFLGLTLSELVTSEPSVEDSVVVVVPLVAAVRAIGGMVDVSGA